MREGRRNGIIVENNILIGIGLGSDFVTEHEYGISAIKEAFNIPKKPTKDLYGADARTIRNIPKDLRFMENNEYGYVIYEYWFKEPTIEDVEYRMRTCNGELLSTAWSDSDFGIRVAKNVHPELLDKLLDAFCKLDIMISLGGRKTAFFNVGLIITIRSAVPEKYLKEMRENDLDCFRLIDAFEATGIKEILEKAGKKYYSLTPHWADESKKFLIFWLNPKDQDMNHSGWFSPKDLILWADNKGPVLKNYG